MPTTTARRADVACPDTSHVSAEWDADNQEWWDWYVALADNDDTCQITLPAAAAPLPAFAAPSAEDMRAELESLHDVSEDDVARFQADGHVRLRGVFSPRVLLHLRARLVSLLAAHADSPLDGALRDRFLSLDMVWLEDALVRQFVLSPRIAHIAATLLGVPAVRLYHDNILSKEPGCGRTPWHYDDMHFPLATRNVVTFWLPVQPVPLDMGPLAFARGIDRYRDIEHVPFNARDTSYDREVDRIFNSDGVEVDEAPFELGDITFHHNQSVHTAGPNRTERSRIVISNTFFADGARIVDEPTMISGDWQKFAPGRKAGEPMDTEVNPICWPPQAPDHAAETAR